MKKSPRTNILVKFTCVSFIAWLLVSPVMTLVAYPTEQHRATARALDQMNTEAWQGKDYTEIYESKEYKTLEQSSENTYSNIVMWIGYGLGGLLFIGLPGWVYYRLRRARATKKPVLATVLITALPQLIVTNLINSALLSALTGLNALAAEFFLYGMLFSCVVVLIITTLFTYGWQGYYNKHNNFIVE